MNDKGMSVHELAHGCGMSAAALPLEDRGRAGALSRS
jgi:hypothetical protein